MKTSGACTDPYQSDVLHLQCALTVLKLRLHFRNQWRERNLSRTMNMGVPVLRARGCPCSTYWAHPKSMAFSHCPTFVLRNDRTTIAVFESQSVQYNVVSDCPHAEYQRHAIGHHNKTTLTSLTRVSCKSWSAICTIGRVAMQNEYQEEEATHFSNVGPDTPILGRSLSMKLAGLISPW